MRSPSLSSLLASSGLLCVASIALAASSWSEFRSIQEPLPCSDGWVGCLVDGQPLDAGGTTDAAGRPHPAAERVGFFDLKPLPAFDPFPPLSSYQAPPRGSEPVAAVTPPTPPPVEPPQRDPEPVAVNTNTNTDPRIVPTRDPDPVAVNTNTNSTSQGGTTIPGRTPLGTPPPTNTNSTTTSTNSTAGTASTPPSSSNGGSSTAPSLLPPPMNTTTTPPVATTTPPATTTTTTPPATTTTTSTPPPEQRDPVAMTTPTETRTTAPAAQDNTCDDLVSLEAPAMMGTLGVGRRKCLEGRLASESSQTAKKKISLVLMQDAEQRQDQADWERIIKRHLQDIDRSDPNLCFKYAIHLSRTGRHGSVIRWADYSLENKQQWEGATYKKNVYALYKLRAQAANSLWQAAEKKFVEERNDANETEATKWRDMTKNYAREWLDYARASEQTTKAPLALCVSAAGSADFCEG